MPAGQALVLGGGGVAGIAWMTGLLAGLADAGQDVTGADLLVGTSAGAAVAGLACPRLGRSGGLEAAGSPGSSSTGSRRHGPAPRPTTRSSAPGSQR